VAEQDQLNDDDLLLQNLLEESFGDLRVLDEAPDVSQEVDVEGPGIIPLDETLEAMVTRKQSKPPVLGFEIRQAADSYLNAVRQHQERVSKGRVPQEEIDAAVADKEYEAYQFPRDKVIPLDKPSVSQIKKALDENPSLRDESLLSKKMADIINAIDQGDDDFAEELLEETPATMFNEEFTAPRSRVGQLGRAVSLRLLPVSPEGEAQPRRSALKNYQQTEARIRKQTQNGEISILDGIRSAFTGQAKMTEEEAKEAGLMRGKDQNPSFFRPVEMFEGGPMVAGGLRDLVTRTAISSGAADLFAPIFLTGKDLERFKQELRAANPTEAMEQVALNVRLARERGEDDVSIKKELRDELNRNLFEYTYRDMPEKAKLTEPDLEVAKKYAKENRNLAMQRERGQISRFVSMVIDGESDKDLQRMLNTVPFKDLPELVWKNTIPSVKEVVDRMVDGVDYIIEAQDASGLPGTLDIERDLGESLLSKQMIDGRIYLVESNVARLLAVIGGLTETVAEVRLPFDIPITPASRDFYYNYGKRDPNSTWWSRVLANIETREMGFSRHLTDDALFQGYSRGDWQYHFAAILGIGADLLVPWEYGQYRIASAPVRTVHGGIRTMRATKGLGYSASAFAAGAFPKSFQKLAKVSKRTTMAAERLAKRFDADPTVDDLRNLVAERGLEAPSYEEQWLAEQLIDLMGRKKNPLSFPDAVGEVATSSKAEVWENVAHITEVFLRKKMKTPDGENLYNNLPPKLQRTIRRVLDTVTDHRDVERQIGIHFSESGKLHVALLDIMAKYGDPESAALRSTPEYRSVAAEVSKLVDDKLLDSADYAVVMGYLEAQAIRSAVDGSQSMQKYNVPTDYMGNIVVRRTDEGSFNIESRVPEAGKSVGSKVNKNLGLRKSQVNALSDFFRRGDVGDLFTKYDPEDPTNPLRLLMGDNYIRTLYKQFDHTTQTRRNGTQVAFLTARGKAQLKDSLNTFFDLQGNGANPGGAGKVGGVYRFYTDFQTRFGNQWVRIRSEADTIGTSVEAKARLNNIFDANKIHEDDAVAIMIDASENRGRGYSVPVKVVISDDAEQQIREGAVAAVGRQKEFWDVNFNPVDVRQALGITDDIEEIAADELFVRAVGYVVGEHFKRNVSSTDFTRLTARSIVPSDKADSIVRAVQARIASVMGTTVDDVFKPNVVAEIEGVKYKGVYDLNDYQQASMRVFLRQLANEPMAKIIPARLFEVGSDLSKITKEEWGALTDALKDIESGIFSRVTNYSEEIPESIGKALWMGIKALGDRAADSDMFLAENIQQLRNAFVVSDDMKNTVGPAQRQVIDPFFMKLEQAPRDVFNWARAAMMGNKDLSMSAMFQEMRKQLTPPVAVDQVDKIGGHSIVRPPKKKDGSDGDFNFPPSQPARKGYVDFLGEFTEAEKQRHVNYEAAKQAAKTSDKRFKKPKEPDILVGKGDPVSADEFAFNVDMVGSKAEFLLKPETIADMQNILLQGGNKMTPELREAFTVLEIYGKKGFKKLDNGERAAMGKAVEHIKDAFDGRYHSIVERGKKLLVAFAGSPGSAILTNLHPTQAAEVYKLFYSGKWTEILQNIAVKKALETGLETIGGPGGRRRLPRYRVTEAFLSAMVRMRAYELLDDMADEMVRNGMPADIKKFSKPDPILNPFGDPIASPIEAESHFWKRVKFYIDQELTFSMMRAEEQIKKVDPDTGKTVIVDRRIIEPQAPGRELYPDSGPDYQAVKGGVVGNPHDFRAYSRAQEILARYGHRLRPEKFELYRFPSGQQGLVPSQLITEIDSALERAANIGAARAGSIPSLRADRIGSPVDIEPIVSTPKRVEDTIGRFIEFVKDKFPVAYQTTKMGVTSGIIVPNPAYFFGVGMGGGLQLYQGVGAVGAARTLFKNNGMVGSVVARMWKDGDYAPGNPILISKSGVVYTADQITELAQLYGLKSSYVLAESPQSLARSMNKLRANGINKVYWTAAEWQRSLVESATAMDNYYRVSVFVDNLERGLDAASAAKLARKVAFDYADLTDVEKKTFRTVFMFYSYLRKNMDLFWDTLLTNPDRIIGQLRAMKGIQNAYIEEDTEVRLYDRDYAKTRLAVGFRNAAAKEHMTDKWMYITPPIPAYDAFGFMAELIGAITGDRDSVSYMTQQINPYIQAPFVYTTQRDFFYQKDINQYNPVPPWLVHLDQTLLGNTLTDGFGIEEVQQIDLSRRYVEGDEYQGHYRAQKGMNWWLWKNLLQIPGAGRSMDTLSYLDRANLGPMELFAKVQRMIHEEGARLGAWKRNPALSRIESDMFAPRTGLTETDELLGLLGIKPFPVPTSQAASQKIIQAWKKDIGLEEFKAKLSSEERVIQKRYQGPK